MGKQDRVGQDTLPLAKRIAELEAEVDTLRRLESIRVERIAVPILTRTDLLRLEAAAGALVVGLDEARALIRAGSEAGGDHPVPVPPGVQAALTVVGRTWTAAARILELGRQMAAVAD